MSVEVPHDITPAPAPGPGEPRPAPAQRAAAAEEADRGEEDGALRYDEWDHRRGHYRRQWCVLRERDVLQRIVVTPRQIDQFLAREATAPTAGEEYDVAHILIAVPPNASPKQLSDARAPADKQETGNNETAK